MNSFRWFLFQILDHLRKVLKGLKPGTAHLILDIWSSRQKLSVIGVQVRFIKDWKLHQFVLGFQHFPGSHDAKAIKKKLEDLLTITYGLSMTDVSFVLCILNVLY